MIVPKHGGDTFGREIRYDFSANLNPLGMPRSVKKALENFVSDWEKYPDPYCRRLTKKLSEHENFPPENIVCGNGAADLIFRIVQAVKPKKAVICAPSFGEYTKALEQCGCEISAYRLAEENGFALDVGITAILDKSVDMLILCTPNNPTGRTIEGGLLREICKKCEENNIIFLCDECFIDFVVNGAGAERFMNKNVVVLKAFTKIYAMAGLRLGYALFGDSTFAEKVRETGQFWSVSSPAQAAGEAALEEKGYAEKTAELIKTEREYLSEKLRRLGLKVYPSEANFILFYAELLLDEMLLRQNILIRNCENFNGLSRGFFRIAVRTHEENFALVSAIERCLNG
ncbi:MAG: pyridoxal phosphate-dependent aminotransferase [Oscillospiraceae bacterium]